MPTRSGVRMIERGSSSGSIAAISRRSPWCRAGSSASQRLPHGAPRVAESGIASAADAARVAEAGYDLALVGSALMAGPDPLTLAAQMLKAAREARARRAP